jgi:hypothetical protein
MLREKQPRAAIVSVLITSGHTIHFEDRAWHVPKKELVSVLQVLLQSGRLKIANLPERELLVKELLAFQVKITAAANETFEAWRERDHDDLVLATALACWWAERRKPQPSFAPTVLAGARLQDGSRVAANVAAGGFAGRPPWFPGGRSGRTSQGVRT